MSIKEYGQYSLVSYVHHLRGERVNVGVVVWHPRFGWRFPVSDDLKRIACIDREVDLDRVKHDLGVIRETLKDWPKQADSPLVGLALQFRNDLVVSEPLKARVVDIDFTSERLSNSLIAPEHGRTRRSEEAILSKKFRKGFAAFVRESLIHSNVLGGEYNFSVKYYNDPIWIAARFRHQDRLVVWRTLTIAKTDNYGKKKLRAQGVNSENEVLRTIPPYHQARLKIAVRVPENDPDAGDPAMLQWLNRHADGVEIFNRIPTINQNDPALILAE